MIEIDINKILSGDNLVGAIDDIIECINKYPDESFCLSPHSMVLLLLSLMYES